MGDFHRSVGPPYRALALVFFLELTSSGKIEPCRSELAHRTSIRSRCEVTLAWKKCTIVLYWLDKDTFFVFFRVSGLEL